MIRSLLPASRKLNSVVFPTASMLKGVARPSVAACFRYSSSSKMMRTSLMKRFSEREQSVLWSLIGAGLLAKTSSSFDSFAAMETQADAARDHDPEEFDYYVKSPTVDDLPILLSKFENDGLDVWPWVWVHPNENGPHHVFVGVNDQVLKRLMELRTESPQNNLLLIVRDESDVENHGDILKDSHCGVIAGTVELLHPRAKILMLKDERIIAFDTLTMV